MSGPTFAGSGLAVVLQFVKFVMLLTKDNEGFDWLFVFDEWHNAQGTPDVLVAEYYLEEKPGFGMPITLQDMAKFGLIVWNREEGAWYHTEQGKAYVKMLS